LLILWGMQLTIRFQIPGDLTIDSDAQAEISYVWHTGTGPGQDRAIRVVHAVQQRLRQGSSSRIEWVPGHSGMEGNERADQLTRELALEKQHGRTCIAWLKELIS
jgi:ribonuclease HI